MIAVIGEIIPSFRKSGDCYVFSYEGIGWKWIEKLSQEDRKVLFLSPIARGEIGRKICEKLIELGMIFDPDMLVPANPPLSVDGEHIIRSSSIFMLDTEHLTDAFSYFSDIDSVIVSSVLLSANPSASAVLDTLSFVSPAPRIAIDISAEEGEIMNHDILEKTLSGFSLIKTCTLCKDESEVRKFLSL